MPSCCIKAQYSNKTKNKLENLYKTIEPVRYIMNSFKTAVDNQIERTENGMKARKSTTSSLVDLFFKIGASRGQDIIPAFVAALVEDEDVAVRIALWARDIRGGSGERKLFRDVLNYLEVHRPELALRVVKKVPEVGRWDDLLVFNTPALTNAAFEMIKEALDSKNGLCAKWLPRKNDIAVKLREYLGMTPKQYRKTLVNLTKVVETPMCSNDWDNINFSQVPSVASARYKKAFNRHTPKYKEYVDSLVKGDNPEVKVNAGAVYPYDILKGLNNYYYDSISYDTTELNHMIKQWEALPNYVGDAKILPMVDVSGSMTCPAGGKGSVSCLDVAVSLGLYISEKNTGNFKDLFLTFSAAPELLHLKGNIVDRSKQMIKSTWNMNTDLHNAMNKILSVAKKGNVPQEDMPEMLLILSDMQFDQCATFDHSAMEMIGSKFEEAGYKVPNIVFWNINARDNVPVKYNETGVALVSGFSPAIMKAVLSSDTEQFTPYHIMLKSVMNERYSF